MSDLVKYKVEGMLVETEGETVESRSTSNNIPGQCDIFESIKHVNEYGQDVWSARELAKTLGYEKWDNFNRAVEKAKDAIEIGGRCPDDHIADSGNMVELGSGAKRNIKDYKLTRLGSYLVTMNCDGSKPVVGEAQNYFAESARQNEVMVDINNQLAHDILMDTERSNLKLCHIQLQQACHDLGVSKSKDYAGIMNQTNVGLYGMDTKDIIATKGAISGEDMYDRMDELELQANSFKAKLAAGKVKQTGISDVNVIKEAAKQAGEVVGKAFQDYMGYPIIEHPLTDKSTKDSTKRVNKHKPLVNKLPRPNN